MVTKASLAATLRDDPRAREAFVVEHRAWAIRYARRRGADSDAEDIAHVALLKVIERPPDALDELHPRAILSVKIRDELVKRWREQGRTAHAFDEHVLERVAPGVESKPGASTLVWLRQLLSKLSSALERLPSGDRKLLRRRYLDEERAVDLASEGQSAAAVRGRVFRALGLLRDELTPMKS